MWANEESRAASSSSSVSSSASPPLVSVSLERDECNLPLSASTNQNIGVTDPEEEEGRRERIWLFVVLQRMVSVEEEASTETKKGRKERKKKKKKKKKAEEERETREGYNGVNIPRLKNNIAS